MATDATITSPTSTWSLPDDFKSTKLFAVGQSALGILASLRLTVVLFALAIFIVLVGTLAQVDKDMWQVMEDYFRSWIAWIDFQVFFPRSWFPQWADRIPGGFWFPGGAAVGLLMALNLISAHLVRFKVQASGPQLLFGSVVIALGSVVTYLVIASGHNADGLQGQPSFTWETFWWGIKVTLALTAAASACALALATPSGRLARGGLIASTVVFGVLATWLFAKGGSGMPSASSLRILWQLIQGGLAGVILLVGCWLVFKRRAGVVLLHAGIGLIMFSEFFVSQYAVEGRMTIREGETINYVRDIRAVELTVIDPTAERTNFVVAVPGSRLQPGSTIKHEDLPFDIHVDRFLKNAQVRDAKPDEETYADQGLGAKLVADPVRAASGTDGGEVDMAAVEVELKKKGSDESLGKLLLSQVVAMSEQPEIVEVNGKPYELFLRFKRDYKDYAIALKDVRKDDYLGTDTPMNYSSDIRLVDEQHKVDRDFKIWMNNPLRYAGETFYQSGYNVDRDGSEITDLQVVTNTGWMMPYVGCMLVAVGMLMHFSLTLVRFQGRQQRAVELETIGEAASARASHPWAKWAIPIAVFAVCGLYIASKTRPPSDRKDGMKIHEFGQLPIIYQGRVKPIDTLARNSLRIVSNKETFEDRDGNEQPAIRWLLDVISGSREADEHRVYRIDNLDVLETLGLQRRKGFRYAESEFIGRIDELERQLREAHELDAEHLNFYQRKLIELEKRIRAVRLLQAAFTPIPFPAIPTEEEFRGNPEEARERLEEIRQMLMRAPQLQAMLERMQPPLAVPVGGRKEWLPYATAWNTAYIERIQSKELTEETMAWTRMLSAYAGDNTKDFNDAVAAYQEHLEEETPAALQEARVPLEFFFNYFQPFKYSMVLYVGAFVLVCLGWLASPFGKFTAFNRTAFWLIVFTLGLHTYALGARIAISGRPPVTNLYSSAVFIGWAAVLMGLVFERFYRLGFGNAIASICGFSTLLIAYQLAADGDTFTVLQAVLDTQFWLATHVVCITLGYSTTFVAGLLGAIYILMLANRRPQVGKALTSMIYGSLCFAIFFSFVGTVLGGLWADDSWGRFWGWDPKENGALIIVLWNALVLHARWGGLVKQRGLAMLAVGGNITTAWSWFGVNELGVGLHSYGFTEGVLRNLGLFFLSQMAIIAFGMAMMVLHDKNSSNQGRPATTG